MNREIKFRAWNGIAMLYSGVHDKNWYTHSKQEDRFFPKCKTDGKNLKVMQYTGIKDKNSVEIYEGDIFEFYFLEEDENNVGKVFWDDVNAMWKIKYYENDHICASCDYQITNLNGAYIVSVIGNIYENPDLFNEVPLSENYWKDRFNILLAAYNELEKKYNELEKKYHDMMRELATANN